MEGQRIKVRAQTISSERVCVHQSTLMQCDFKSSIDCFARHEVSKTAVWTEKLDEVGLRSAKSILRNAGVESISYCASGLFAGVEKGIFDQSIEDCRRRIEEAAEIGASSIVIITGGLPDGSKDLNSARLRSKDALVRLAGIAGEAGIQIALEPLHPMVCGLRSVISTLDEAIDLVEGLDGGETIGFAVDTYALWWDTGLNRAIERAGNRIINFHVSDWLLDTRDVRLDRGMPGDGIIDIRNIRSSLEKAGFRGEIEVEILSRDRWWKRDPDVVVQSVLTALDNWV